MKKLITKGFTIGLVIVMTLGLAVIFSGCGETQATLEDIAASSGLDATITDKIEQPAGTTVAVTFSGDSFDVTYTYDDEVDENLQKKLAVAFDKSESKIKESCEAAIDDLQTQTGITGIVGTVKIINANGSEIWSKSYPEQ